MRSCGIPCSPARKISAPKPTHPQTVMITTAKSAWCGEEKKPNVGRPSLLSPALMSPNSGSMSQVKITPVAMVEVTTGMNTASR